MSLFDSTLIAGVLGSGATAAGLFYAARQLKLSTEQSAAQDRWKRTEFARAFLDRLTADEELAFCGRALDWGVGPLPIPMKHRALFPPGTIIMQHDWKLLLASVEVNIDSNWNKPEQLTYRYSFDAFFSYLESLSHYVRSGLVESDDLVGLEYYLKLVRVPPYAPVSNTERPKVFRKFVERFYPDLEPFIWPPAPA